MHDGHDCGCGCQQSNSHNCGSEQPHTHQHGGCHCADSTPSDETKALLEYMLNHNRSHADELNSLAHKLGGDEAALVYKALMSYESGNQDLAKALELLKQED